MAVFKHDSFAFAINDECGVFAFDKGEARVGLDVLAFELEHFFAVVLDVPSVVLEFLGSRSLDFNFGRTSSRGAEGLFLLGNFSCFGGVFLVCIFLNMLEAGLAGEGTLLDFGEEVVGLLLQVNWGGGSGSWVSELLFSLADLGSEALLSICLSSPFSDLLLVGL